MKTLKKIMTFAAVSLLPFAHSCDENGTKTNKVDDKAKITLSLRQISVESHYTGEKLIDVTVLNATDDHWTLTGLPQDEWFTADTTEGEGDSVVTLNFKANYSADNRSKILRFSLGEETYTEITVIQSGATNMGDEKTRADLKPNSFSGFYRRSMILDHTGTGCGYCPFITAQLNKIEAGTSSDDVVIVAAHTYNSGDPMYNNAAVAFKNRCGISSYPSLNIDMRKTGDAMFVGSGATANTILGKCRNAAEKYPAKVAISAAVKYDETDKLFDIAVKLKFGETGKYKLGILVLEDKVAATQSNFGASGYDFNVHYNALRASYSTTADGEKLNDGEEIAANTVIYKEYQMGVPSKAVGENCRIVVFVTTPDDDTSTQYYVNNIINCKLNDNVPFKYVDIE